MPTTTTSAASTPPSSSTRSSPGWRRVARSDAGPRRSVDAVVRVQAPNIPPISLAEHAVQRYRPGVDEHDLGAHLTCRRCHFRADPSGADHRGT